MKVPPVLAASIAVLLAVIPFYFSQGQDPDWQPPGTEESAEVEKANTEIAVVYERLMSKLDPAGQKSLKEAQRSWIKWRDDEALLIARVGGSVGGSGMRVDILTAQARLIRERTKVLGEYAEQAGDN